MQTGDDILKLLVEKGAEAAQRALRGLIVQPGALGDCILTLPLARLLKEQLKLGSVTVLGHTRYTGILPGRTCVDCVQSIDSVSLHRLFLPTEEFDLDDNDPLISVFAGYTWIISFLGEPDSSVEQNLIFTTNCSHSAEVITLSAKPKAEFSGHITEFYARQLIGESGVPLEPPPSRLDTVLIEATRTDTAAGMELLEEMEADFSKKLVVIHPGSGGVGKCWHIDNFVALAAQLSQADFEVIFVLGPAESERFGEKVISKIGGVAKRAADLSLAQVVAILSCADIYIGNDSGITHLSAALGRRTISVFGPSRADWYRPVGPAVTVLKSENTDFSKKPCPELQRQVHRLVTA